MVLVDTMSKYEKIVSKCVVIVVGYHSASTSINIGEVDRAVCRLCFHVCYTLNIANKMTDEKQQKRVQIEAANKKPKKTRHRRRHHHHHHHRRPVYLTTTPDGGWGWVVIFATFMVFVFTLGFKTSMGVFYVHWERHFAVPKYQVSWVTSMSPLVIGIISKYIFLSRV